MGRFRFSLAKMLVAVVVIAVGLAALVNASELWVKAAGTLAVVSLFVAIVGVLYSRDARRAFWCGIAIFGWGYLASGLLPNSVRQPLLTTSVLNYLYPKVSRIEPPTFDGAVVVWFQSDGTILVDGRPVTSEELDAELLNRVPRPMETEVHSGGLVSVAGVQFAVYHDAGMLSNIMDRMNRLQLRVVVDRQTTRFPSYSDFARVGHSLFVLLFALFGGLIASVFYAVRDRSP